MTWPVLHLTEVSGSLWMMSRWWRATDRGRKAKLEILQQCLWRNKITKALVVMVLGIRRRGCWARWNQQPWRCWRWRWGRSQGWLPADDTVCQLLNLERERSLLFLRGVRSGVDDKFSFERSPWNGLLAKLGRPVRVTWTCGSGTVERCLRWR